MTRKYSTIDPDTRMKNNREKNKQFESACRAAQLSEEEKHKFSEVLHSDTDFQTGDYEYEDLVAFAKEFKKEDTQTKR